MNLTSSPVFNSLEAFIELCNKEIYNRSGPLNYLKNRFVSESVINKYKIGFCPCNIRLDQSCKFSKEFDYQFKNNKNILVNKLVFPIYNIYGDLTGFILRSYEGPKVYYKFNPRSSLSTNYLYGINENLDSIKKLNSVLLLESPFDLYAIEGSIGIGVAVLQAKLTMEQALFLKRVVKKVFLCFNNDFESSRNSGFIGMEVAEKVLKKINMRVSIIKLPYGVNDLSSMREKNSDFEVFLKNKMCLI